MTTTIVFIGTKDECNQFSEQVTASHGIIVLAHSEKELRKAEGWGISMVLYNRDAEWLSDPNDPMHAVLKAAYAMADDNQYYRRRDKYTSKPKPLPFDWRNDESYSRKYEEYIKKVVPNKWEKVPTKEPLSCMWCAQEFPDTESLESHEMGCA